MLRKVRLEYIKNFVVNQKNVTVEQLSEEFNVSTVTIRNDLTKLEKEGHLIRTHGGAVSKGEELSEDTKFDLSLLSINDVSRMEKTKEIAKIAAKYIKDDSWIYISSGITCFELAKEICGRSLNVVCGGLDSAMLLSHSKATTVFVPGGNVMHRLNGHQLVGDWYLKALDELHFDMAFVSVSGAHLEYGFSANNSVELLHMKKIRSVSDETIVILDSNKFGQKAFMSVGDLTYADTIITNNDLPKKYTDFISEHNINLILD